MSGETLTIDRLDRRLVHALSLDGRLPFRRIAAVLGSSEQTVARRYRRLREAGVLRVIVIRDPRRARENLFVRIDTTPGSAMALGGALGRRPDVSWVNVSGAGTALLCAVRTDDVSARDGLLLERLPRVGEVTNVRTMQVLNIFAGDPRSEWTGLDDPLTDEEIAALDPRPTRPSGLEVGADENVLTDEDEELQRHLMLDGRMSYAALAALTGRREDAVARRVETLLREGALFVDLELVESSLGYGVNATLWLTVAPADLDAVGRQVSLHPESAFTAAVSGDANLLVAVVCRDTSDLYRYLTERLGPIDAIRSVETSISDRVLKRAGTIMDGERLPSPA